jgi:hypothetical protein
MESRCRVEIQFRSKERKQRVRGLLGWSVLRDS